MAELRVSGNVTKLRDDPHLGEHEVIGDRIYCFFPRNKDGSYVFESTTTKIVSSITNSSTQPRPMYRMIVLCTWMGASKRHIAKYTQQFQTRYPGIPLMLIRSDAQDMFTRSTAAQIKRMQPAASKIVQFSHTAVALDGQLDLLLHVMSNGGSWCVYALSEAYKATSKMQYAPPQLPLTSLVLDSAPSLPHIRLAHNAMMQGIGVRNVLLRWLASIFFWIGLLMYFATWRLKLQVNMLPLLRAALNDPTGPFMVNGVSRAYICSKEDAMVPMDDVLQHAAQAREERKKQGLIDNANEVVLEEFIGSSHVGHMMTDSERYWKIIDDTWSRGVRVTDMASP